VLFVSALDAILALPVAIGEDFGDDADTTRHILTAGLLKNHGVSTLNF
jgi:hypothetical protein